MKGQGWKGTTIPILQCKPAFFKQFPQTNNWSTIGNCSHWCDQKYVYSSEEGTSTRAEEVRSSCCLVHSNCSSSYIFFHLASPSLWSLCCSAIALHIELDIIQRTRGNICMGGQQEQWCGSALQYDRSASHKVSTSGWQQWHMASPKSKSILLISAEAICIV